MKKIDREAEMVITSIDLGNYTSAELDSTTKMFQNSEIRDLNRNEGS